MLAKHLEDYMTSRNTKKHSPPPRHPAGGAHELIYNYEEDAKKEEGNQVEV
jgi:hypothetical protein